MDFADEARSWAGVWISDKLPRNGDFILCYRAPNGEPAEPKILIDNKDKSAIVEGDIDKLVRDCKERSIPVAALVARDETQLRQADREAGGTAKMECGCSEPHGSGSGETLTSYDPSSSGCESKASTCWKGTPFSPKNFGAHFPRSTASRRNSAKRRRRSSLSRRSSCDIGNACANSVTLPRVADQRPPQNGTAVCLVLRNTNWRETDDD
jgi:hypothetical protein